jgi:hypothetical protein
MYSKWYEILKNEKPDNFIIDKKNYYKFKDNKTVFPYKKDIIGKYININDINTILPFCELFDIPFISEVWFQKIINFFKNENNYKNKKQYFINRTIFGRYLATMKLCGYKKRCFKADIPLQLDN